ncbi:2-dehydro-3-deoxygalactonokinase [Sphingomonas canadensis]|uniref:2-dehydro-3-deoxygalactonokinase n=1 Tax=Sphingomonas canadensis TaxID=1219257 RepID=A0ABW3H5U4_9SPHN|nr:2-dehydro-3-deoxygalactonokinase [Sphingomonas canadensis]MCW3836471.1 2-dehydro-3-deoxygalactonokinase [Sphingomonas canadensis]
MMRFAGPFLAVDWGTTNRRCFRIEAGRVTDSASDDRGAAAVTDFAAEAAGLRARLGDLPMLLAGMVGSSIGWRTAPYAPAPAGIPALAAALTWIDARTVIVPGVATARDVMRGEELQLLGAAIAGMAPPDALLCQPGTHSKWARMEAGRIAGFTTAMTGELFALIRSHGLLAAQLGAPAVAGAAFLEGEAEGRRRDLAASLFGIRASGLLGLRDDADAASHASGLLIGAEVAARLAESRADAVHILTDSPLGGLYAAAIEAQGARAILLDSRTAFISGAAALATEIA